ncbi:MAG: septum formation family protein [Acidimicrobiales bacterium]
MPTTKVRSPQASANAVESFTPGGISSGLSKEAKRGILVLAGVVAVGILALGVSVQRFASSNTFVNNLAEGDCITDFFEEDSDGYVYAFLVPTTDCGNDHAMEVYSVHPDLYPSNSYPGIDNAWETGDQWCFDTFERFVGERYEQSPLEYWTFVPDEIGWDSGDRNVQCVIGHFDRSTKVTGSLRNSAGRSFT